jgi:hypothetical protein
VKDFSCGKDSVRGAQEASFDATCQRVSPFYSQEGNELFPPRTNSLKTRCGTLKAAPRTHAWHRATHAPGAPPPPQRAGVAGGTHLRPDVRCAFAPPAVVVAASLHTHLPMLPRGHLHEQQRNARATDSLREHVAFESTLKSPQALITEPAGGGGHSGKDKHRFN